MSYTRDKAEKVITRAGGDPATAGPLAQWAQAALEARAAGTGVIVGRDGTVLGTTVLNRSTTGEVWYADRATTARYEMSGNQLGLALASIRREVGQDVLHVTYSDVCTGSGKAAR